MFAAKRPTILIVLLAALASTGSTPAASSHHFAWRITHTPSSWVPAPPPPSVIDEFLALYSGYSALPSPKLWTFDEWIVRHGVIDPLRRRWMLTLYLWMERRADA